MPWPYSLQIKLPSVSEVWLQSVKLTWKSRKMASKASSDPMAQEKRPSSIVSPASITPRKVISCLKVIPITGLSTDRVTKRGISRTYQNIRLFKNMTVVENILVGMHPHLRSGHSWWNHPQSWHS